MTTIDIIILIIIGAGVVAGFMKGFIRQLASILGLVAHVFIGDNVVDRKSTRLNFSHPSSSRMPSSA